MGKKAERGPKYIASPLNNDMINYAEYYLSATEKALFFLLTFVAGGKAGMVFYGGLFKADGEATMATMISNAVVFCGTGCIAAKFFIPVLRENMRLKRNKKLEKQFVNMLDGLASSLAAGNTVNGAFVNAEEDMKNQYSEDEAIVREISEIVLGLRNGRTLEEMVAAFGARSNSEDIENFSNVISNCHRMGGNFKDVIRKTRDIISDKSAIENEITTKLASNKLQLNAMCIMPVMLVAMLKMSSSSFADNLASALGVVVTTLAIGLFVASYFWGRKIIDIR